MIWEVSLQRVLRHDHTRFDLNVRFASSPAGASIAIRYRSTSDGSGSARTI